MINFKIIHVFIEQTLFTDRQTKFEQNKTGIKKKNTVYILFLLFQINSAHHAIQKIQSS